MTVSFHNGHESIMGSSIPQAIRLQAVFMPEQKYACVLFPFKPLLRQFLLRTNGFHLDGIAVDQPGDVHKRYQNRRYA